MKLRILNNSIRLRLTRTEVSEACDPGLVRAQLRFPGGETFVYALESSPAFVRLEAEFAHNALTVRVPSNDIREWALSDQVSISFTEAIAANESLAILVEKDFACLAPRDGVDETDMYPHPLDDQNSC